MKPDIKSLNRLPDSPSESDVDSTSKQFQAKCKTRLDELTAFCNSEYNLPPELTHLIATVLIPTHPYRPIWLTIESERHPFWVHLSAALELLGFPKVHNCAELRHNGPLSVSRSSRNMAVWVEQREMEPRITVDTQAETRMCWKGMHIYHPYWLLCRESVRAYSKFEYRMPEADAEQELARLLRLVIDPNRRLMPRPVQLSKPILKLVEFIAKANKEIELGPYYENLTMIPSSHAVMLGRDRLEPEDWDVLSYVLAGSVKQWNRKLMHYYWSEVMPIDRGKYDQRWARIDKYLTNAMAQKIVHSNGKQLSDLADAGWLKLYVPPRRIALMLSLHHKHKYYDIAPLGEIICRLMFDPEFDITADIEIVEPDTEAEAESEPEEE